MKPPLSISLQIEAVYEDGEWTFFEDVPHGRQIKDLAEFADQKAAKIKGEISAEGGE